MTTVVIAKSAPARIAKGKLGVYFAWGAFSKRDGEVFTDSHGDQIPDEELVAGALSLAKSAQLGHEHDGTITGSVPLVMPLAEDIQAALELTSPHAGLAVGFQPNAAMAKAIDEAPADAQWQMSIEGEAFAELVKATIAKSADAGEQVAKAEHRRTLRKLRIDKIDLVRAAAHGPGTAIAIAKRKSDESAPVAKRAPALTDATNGHQHLVEDAECSDGFTSYERQPGAEYGHSHPWVRAADGSITVGAADGHTHAISTGDATMADDLTKSLQADLAKARATVGAVLALPAEQIAYAKRLDEAGVVAFIAKSATERAELAKPVHVAKSGEVFYASDDARLVSMAKAHDAMVVEVEKARGEAQVATIAKAAAAIPHVKGAALLAKAVHGVALTDAERAEALAALATVDASIATVTKGIGSGAEPATGNALAAYDAGLAAFAKAAGKSPDHVADEFLGTPEGARLYAAYADEARPARA